MGGATGLDSRVARETRLDIRSAFHLSVHSTVTVCMLFRVQDCTRHATAFSSVLRLLCCEDVVRPGASCRARAERRDETRTVRNVGASRETGLPSATQAQRVVHTRLTVVLLHKGLRA